MKADPPPARPTVDVLVSTFNEEAYIGRCLDHVLDQDYPGDRIRVLVIDGGSTDRTVELVRRRAAGEPRLELIADGHRRNLPEALNLGLERCSGDLVAKIDAHGYPERDYLALAADGFQAGGAGVGCVGGRPVQEGETHFGRAVGLGRTSRFGVGGSEYAGSSARALVETVQCGVYLRDALEDVGWFDPTMNYGEDEELNWRLRRSGYRILLDTRIRFHYVTRPSWRAAFRQYRNYGAARARVVHVHPGFLRPHHLVPAAFVVLLAALGVAAVRRPEARLALAGATVAYAGGSLAAAAQVTPKDRRKLLPLVAACFPAFHFGYGVGSIEGAGKVVRGRLGRHPAGTLSSTGTNS